MADSDFVRVADVSEIPPGDMKKIRAHRRDMLLINVAGNLYACDSVCPHQLYTLATGELDGEEITCSLHGAVFNVTTGAVVSPPAREPLNVFEVRVEGSDVLVGLVKQ